MKTERFWKILYVCLVLVILVVPSLGLLVFRSGEAESADSKNAPVLITEEGLNQDFLKDAGNYFEDHFALRDEMVTGYALLGANIFRTSTQPKVAVGNNGWLYYTDTLDDYQALNQLSDRQLFDIAHSLRLMQDYLKSEGIPMLFVMVPNKNSLYDENMPYYYLRGADGQKNLSRIKPYLEAEGVNYLSLEDVLLSDEPLYMAKDSHWNNLGAALATEVILKKLSLPCKDYTSAVWTTREDYEGDLDGMIFPAAITKEAQVYTDPAPAFEYKTPVESNYDPRINTTASAPSSEKSLVMYRDSFGNAILPFMAENFAECYFSRSSTLSATDLTANNPDVVIIEKVERFLYMLAENAPNVQSAAVTDAAISASVHASAPIFSSSAAGAALIEGSGPELSETEDAAGKTFYSESDLQLSVETAGSNTVIKGVLPEGSFTDTSRIFADVDGTLYEAYPTTDKKAGAEGFRLTLPARDASAISIYVY